MQIPPLLNETLQADSFDALAEGLSRMLQEKVRHHSILVSLNGLDEFNPWMIWDAQSHRCAPEDFIERYHLLDPAPFYLRNHIGLKQSVLREQLPLLPPDRRERYCGKFMKEEGWDKYAEIYFWNECRLDASICLRRSPDQPDFNSRELRYLAMLRTVLMPCVNRLHRLRHERSAMRSLKEVFLRGPAPLILLDWGLRPISFNYQARRLCLEWTHGRNYARLVKGSVVPRIPVEILEGCEARRNLSSGLVAGSGMDRRPSFSVVRHPRRADLSAQIERVAGNSPGLGGPSFLVRFNELSRSDDTDEAPAGEKGLSLLAGLTRCERDVALQVCRGFSNLEIARQLGKSEPTVKMQLRTVFQKLGVSNRTHLASVLNVSTRPDTSFRM